MSTSLDTPRAARPGASSIRVREVSPSEATGAFARLSWTMNAGDPNWVAPLRMALDPILKRKHPFHEHADVAWLLAERDGKPVGRIAAVVNHRYNEFHGDRVGFFGLFESVDDADVARALVDAAAEWLKARGMDTIRGPFNLSTNDELHSPGVLIEGFDTPPAVMMGHNPPYYGRLMEAAGLAKAKDVVAYWLPHNKAPEHLLRGVDRLAKREGWRIRQADLKRLKEETAVIQEVYNSAWERNWGFVPMTRAEFENMAKDLKSVVDPELVMIAETLEGEPIGFLLAMPDLNEVFRKIPTGRLFPFGIFHFLRLLLGRVKIRRMRVLTLGLKPGLQSAGIGAAMYLRLFQVGSKNYDHGEASWILEDNHRMCKAMENVGAYVYKRYRIYERAL